MIPLGSTATNPQTGHTIVLTEKGWVDSGSPQMGAAMSPGDQQAIGSLGDDARNSQWLAHKGDQFRQVQQGTGPGDVTGTGMQYHDVRIPLPLLDKVNLNPAVSLGAVFNPRIGDMESISNQAWTHMRPTGSGPMRMPEIEGFQQAFPNIENSPQTNTDISRRLDQDASFDAQRLQFIDQFMRQNRGSYADANAAWQAAQAAPGDGGVVYGPGSPMQGQSVTAGQQNYAASNPSAGPVGGSQNPYYSRPGGQVPQGSYGVTQDGQLMAPPGQLNMQNGLQNAQQPGAPQMQQPGPPQPQGAPQQPAPPQQAVPQMGGWQVVGVS